MEFAVPGSKASSRVEGNRLLALLASRCLGIWPAGDRAGVALDYSPGQAAGGQGRAICVHHDLRNQPDQSNAALWRCATLNFF